jgi:glycosyltransferase involved in cell wall biosynthesis
MLAPGAVYGAETLLLAFGLLHAGNAGAHLALFGPGTHAARGQALRLCPSAAGNVHGFGELGRPQALALMRAADVFVRPTLADGDSVSVREALALGRRVVCTSVGTRPPGVQLVPPGDARALSEGLLSALERPEGSASNADTDLLSVLLPRYGLSPRPTVPGGTDHE